MHLRPSPRIAGIASAILLLLAACQPTSPAPSASAPAPSQTQPAVAIDAAGIRAHLDALQAIADANDGLRMVGTPGYDASVEYVAAELRELGYAVETPEFEMATFTELPGASIQVGDGGPSFGGGPDFHAMVYSGSGDVSAPIVAVGFDEADEGGCAGADWVDFPPGAIALAPPGPCFRRQVVFHALDAGAVALVVSYPQWPTGQVRRPTLLMPQGISIPAISASGQVGDALLAAAEAGVDVHLSVETEIGQAMVRNVIAESHGSAERVVMLGGHLDAVNDGPGLNDNGSGTAALLEIARFLADQAPQVGVRLAFWGGEEFGLHGSRAYVEELGTEERAEIMAYLNLDMLGSQNFVPFVYDQADAAPGSAAIADFLIEYLETEGIGSERTDLGGASDHANFVGAGIPTGGIFSGATELKSTAQAGAFGGTAGEPLDGCYHLACDTVANVNIEQVASLTEAALAVALALASGQLLIP